MGPIGVLELGIIILISQAWASPHQQHRCGPDVVVFKVEQRHLQRGRVLGKVVLDDCLRLTAFGSSDGHFKVARDGTLKVSTAVTLHGGQTDFIIYSRNPKEHKLNTTVRVILHDDGHLHHGNHPNQVQEHHSPGNHHRNQHQSVHVDFSNNTELPVLYFPRFSGLRRQKRAWVVPPINFPENHKGPFPKHMVQIRSDADKEVKVQYTITGPGADEPPVRLFTINKFTGELFVNQPLDRELKDKYMLQAHAETDGNQAEEVMDIIIKVIDQNDNRPIFTKDLFEGEVAEDSKKDYEVITVVATDLDEPGNANSDLRYYIWSQEPKLPMEKMFEINPVSGAIRLNHAGLDREKYPKYTLEVKAIDMAGDGFDTMGHVILTVTDSNDNAPAFEMSTYEASVPENKAGALVKKMSVTDKDDAHSPAWNAKFQIVGGDPEGLFAVETGPSKQEGILTTVKGLDFEASSTHTLLVAVENDIPFAGRLPTATATVVVSVEDVNEAPVFSPPIKVVTKREDLAVGTAIAPYIATDPDTARKQKVTYKIIKDPARWLSVDKDTGMIKVKSSMDREGFYVKNLKYTAVIAAFDDDAYSATGTGTLEINLQDVNDNFPTINERSIRVCNKESASQLLTVTDADGPDFSAPFAVLLKGTSSNNWTAEMNETRTGIILTLTLPSLPSGDYSVEMNVADSHGMEQVNIVQATVCDCTGDTVSCKGARVAGVGLPVILGVLGGILLLLMLLLLLLMFLKNRTKKDKEPLLPEDDIRDNIYYYDEEGGGEDDQDYYDLSVIHRGLDNRPDVFRNDVMPNFMPPVQYRPRPANPEDIGNFIDDNLKAADTDPLAPPYDSLLVFDDEGKGSDAGSLSSLNSSSSGDQDYDCLGEWGPRFKKLADMYGGGEEDEMM